MTDHMTDTAPRPEPIRARTVTDLRWIAIGGQLATVGGAWALGVRFPIWPVLGLIAMTAALNLWLTVARRPQMSPARVTAHLLFDLGQLAALLALTGGLSNPFSLLMLAPVSVSAAVLGAQRALAIGMAAIILVSLGAVVALPLAGPLGQPLAIAPLLALGHWLALVVGIGFVALYAHRVTAELSSTENALFATQMALAREQRLQHLGGVVAAAAHEMGTPLGTIKLIAGELGDELRDRPELVPDIDALRNSADRCARILREMGQAGKDDLLLHSAPLGAVLGEAAGPHANRGIALAIDADMAIIRRDPAVVHGLRNLIQNGVDFARSAVTVAARHHGGVVQVVITDDGGGYPPAVLARIGEPYPAGRRAQGQRAGYEGMGLGLFIAKTLLERSGAVICFANGARGAEVTVTWPEARILASGRGRLGENPKISR